MGLFDAILAPEYSNSASENWSSSEGGSWQQTASQSASAQDLWTDAETANINAHNEAELNRMFQAYMSNTAYQRAVQDLKKAGINPILAAINGGATTPSGATAQSFMNSYGTSRSSSSSYGSGGSYNYSDSYGYSNSQSDRGIQNLPQAMIDGAKDIANGMVTLASKIGGKAYNNASSYAGNYIGRN